MQGPSALVEQARREAVRVSGHLVVNCVLSVARGSSRDEDITLGLTSEPTSVPGVLGVSNCAMATVTDGQVVPLAVLSSRRPLHSSRRRVGGLKAAGGYTPNNLNEDVDAGTPWKRGRRTRNQ